jgi:D-alanine-D-alanine ligase
VVLKKGFYSYSNKYGKQDNVNLVIPATLTKDQASSIQKIALKTYRVLACNGMARVDMFLKENGDIYVNEVNTLPGFTKISMYPKL